MHQLAKETLQYLIRAQLITNPILREIVSNLTSQSIFGTSYSPRMAMNPFQIIQMLEKEYEQLKSKQDQNTIEYGFLLGFCFVHELGSNPRDKKQGVELLTIAADYGYAPAITELANAILYVEPDNAIKLLGTAIARGYAPAQYARGVLHEEGNKALNIPKDKRKAIECFMASAEDFQPAKEKLTTLIQDLRTRAEGKEIEALRDLGYCCEISNIQMYFGYTFELPSNIYPKSYVEALALYYKAASLRTTFSEELENDINRIFIFLEKSLPKNCSEEGIRTLLEMEKHFYRGSVGLPKNIERAKKVMEIAEAMAEKTRNCLHALGMHYEYRYNHPHSQQIVFRKAIKYYHLNDMKYLTPLDNTATLIKALTACATSAEPDRQCDLAYCYENGYGVAVDILRAIELYHLAAKNKQMEAKESLDRLLSGLLAFDKKLGEEKEEKEVKEVKERKERFDVAGPTRSSKELSREEKAQRLYILAVCHEKGYGVPLDLSKAVLYYEKAIEGGFKPATFYLAEFYEKDHSGVSPLFSPNLELATKHYELSAENKEQKDAEMTKKSEEKLKVLKPLNFNRLQKHLIELLHSWLPLQEGVSDIAPMIVQYVMESNISSKEYKKERVEALHKAVNSLKTPNSVFSGLNSGDKSNCLLIDLIKGLVRCVVTANWNQWSVYAVENPDFKNQLDEISQYLKSDSASVMKRELAAYKEFLEGTVNFNFSFEQQFLLNKMMGGKSKKQSLDEYEAAFKILEPQLRELPVLPASPVPLPMSPAAEPPKKFGRLFRR